MWNVAVEDFGKDHWSTLAYIETVCVDNKGVPDRQRMRCNARVHPGLISQANIMFPNEPDPPTRLRGYFRKDGTKDPTRALADHDDWSCADDLVAAGFLEWGGTGMHPVFRLTEKGKAMAAALRAHKAGGGMYATFAPAG